MYFLIENNDNVETYEIVDYNENFSILEEKQKLLQEKTDQETKFVNKIVIPFIKKYNVYLNAEWQLLLFENKKAKYEDHLKKFTENYLKNADLNIVKYLRFSGDRILEFPNIILFTYEIKGLKIARGDSQIP